MLLSNCQMVYALQNAMCGTRSSKENTMQWNLENLKVSARYLGDFPVQGIVTLSRVKYGGGVSHHIKLDLPLVVYGAIRDTVIVDHADVYSVASR
jgi:hypothetical protein